MGLSEGEKDDQAVQGVNQVACVQSCAMQAFLTPFVIFAIIRLVIVCVKM
jgi:hypothetical protein